MSITVNGEQVEVAMIDHELDLLRQRAAEQLPPEALQQQEAQLASDAKENAIERLLLVQEARRKYGAPPAAETERRLRELQKPYGSENAFMEQTGLDEKQLADVRAHLGDAVLLDRYFEEICRPVVAPSDDECRAHYDSHLDEFQQPEMLRASHIARRPSAGQDPAEFHARMLNIREQLCKGADFALTARLQSQCHDDGGHLGWFPRGAMVDSFDRVVFPLQPGAISEIFQTEFGYHIATVHEHKQAGIRPYEEVREAIRTQLLEQRKNDAIGLVVDGLREKGQIVETAEAAAAPDIAPAGPQ